MVIMTLLSAHSHHPMTKKNLNHSLVMLLWAHMPLLLVSYFWLCFSDSHTFQRTRIKDGQPSRFLLVVFQFFPLSVVRRCSYYFSYVSDDW